MTLFVSAGVAAYVYGPGLAAKLGLNPADLTVEPIWVNDPALPGRAQLKLKLTNRGDSSIAILADPDDAAQERKRIERLQSKMTSDDKFGDEFDEFFPPDLNEVPAATLSVRILFDGEEKVKLQFAEEWTLLQSKTLASNEWLVFTPMPFQQRVTLNDDGTMSASSLPKKIEIQIEEISGKISKETRTIRIHGDVQKDWSERAEDVKKLADQIQQADRFFENKEYASAVEWYLAANKSISKHKKFIPQSVILHVEQQLRNAMAGRDELQALAEIERQVAALEKSIVKWQAEFKSAQLLLERGEIVKAAEAAKSLLSRASARIPVVPAGLRVGDRARELRSRAANAANSFTTLQAAVKDLFLSTSKVIFEEQLDAAKQSYAEFDYKTAAHEAENAKYWRPDDGPTLKLSSLSDMAVANGQIFHFGNSSERVMLLKFGKQMNHLAAVTSDGHVEFWNFKLRESILNHFCGGRFACADLRVDERVLVGALTHLEGVRVWDLSDPAKPLSQLSAVANDTSHPTAIAFAPNGPELYCASSAGAFRWDRLNDESHQRLYYIPFDKPREDTITSIAVSAGGKRVFVSYSSGLYANLNAEKYQPLKHVEVLNSQKATIRIIVSSPDRDEFCTIGDNAVIRWNLDGTQRGTLQTSSACTAAAYGTEGMLVTGHENGDVCLWNADGRRVGSFQAHHESVTAIAISNSKLIATGDSLGNCIVMDLSKVELARE